MKKFFALILALVMCLSVCAFAEIDAYKTLLGDCVDWNNYDAPDADEDSVTIWRTEKTAPVFDFVVTLQDGTVVEINGKTVYQNLLDLGWSSNMPETADAMYSYINSCTAPDGKWVTISLCNPTEAAMPIAETFVTSISFDKDYAPDFDLSGLSFASTIADVTAVFGEPYYVYYSETLGLTLKYEDENINTLKFVFDAEGALAEVDYSFNRNSLV